MLAYNENKSYRFLPQNINIGYVSSNFSISVGCRLYKNQKYIIITYKHTDKKKQSLKGEN